MKLLRLIAILVLVAEAAFSADFYCNTGNVDCLIAAINTANINNQDNSIFLDMGEFRLRTVNNMNDGPNGLPSITGRVVIHGPQDVGSTISREDADPAFRIFHVAAGGNLTLDWLGIRGGQVGKVNELVQGGGAIFNRGTLVVNRAAIYNNRTALLPGGGIYNLGAASITHTDIRNNEAGADTGGGVASQGALIVEDSFIFRNSGEGVGGIFNSGFATVTRTTVSENMGLSAGGIDNLGLLWIESSGVHRNTGFTVGGLRNSNTLTVVSSTISHNMANTGGGVYFGNLLL
jgi:hypothetical protein